MNSLNFQSRLKQIQFRRLSTHSHSFRRMFFQNSRISLLTWSRHSRSISLFKTIPLPKHFKPYKINPLFPIKKNSHQNKKLHPIKILHRQKRVLTKKILLNIRKTTIKKSIYRCNFISNSKSNS